MSAMFLKSLILFINFIFIDYFITLQLYYLKTYSCKNIISNMFI